MTIQVHPDKTYAREILGSDYGKTESWYILGSNSELIQPCIYLGFKPGVTREIWKDIFDRQDIPAMLDCLHKIPVHAGECYFISAGVPHAIGEGCFLAEIQEPTDYTMRTELVTPAGLRIHENQCHQGVGYEKMLDCFHYDGASLEETLALWRSGFPQSPRTSLRARPKTRITGALPMDQMEGSPAEEPLAHAPSLG